MRPQVHGHCVLLSLYFAASFLLHFRNVSNSRSHGNPIFSIGTLLRLRMLGLEGLWSSGRRVQTFLDPSSVERAGSCSSGSRLAGAASAKVVTGRRGQKLIETITGLIVSSWERAGSSQDRGKCGGCISTM